MTSQYRITYRDGRTEDVHATVLSHAHDGTVSWIVLHDELGEVLRVRSADIDRVERVAPIHRGS